MRMSQLIAYAAPGAAIKGMTLPLMSYLPPVYASLSGFSLGTVGLVFMIARLWDLVTDPVAGVVMDRTNPPFGKRKFWMAAATPALMASIWLLFNPGPDAALPSLIGLLIFFYVAWTVLTISHAAWPADLARAQADRTRLIAWREWAGVLGMLAVLAAPVLLAEPDADLKTQLSIIGGTLVVLLPVVVIPALLVLPHAKAVPANPVQQPKLLDSWHLLCRSQQIRRLLLADLLSGCGYAANSATSYFVFANLLQLESKYSLIMLAFMIGMIIGVPVMLKFSLKLGASRGFAIAMLGSAAISLCLAALPDGALVLAVAANAALGFFTGGYQFNLNAEMVRLATEDHARLGVDRSSQHLALLTMTNKAGYALAVGGVYLMLEAFGGQNASVSNVPKALVIGLGLFVPACFFVASSWAFSRINRMKDIENPAKALFES